MPDQKIEVELPESLTKLVEKVDALNASIEKLTAGGEKPDPALTTELGTLKAEFAKVEAELAGVSADFQKQIAARQEALELAKAELARSKATHRRETFVKFAAKELPDLPGATADDFAETLDKIDATLEKAAFDKFCQRLRSWNALVRKSADLFKEVGVDGNQPSFGSAEAVLNAAAKTKMAESDGKLTFPQAYAKVLEEQPQLYARYRAEQET